MERRQISGNLCGGMRTKRDGGKVCPRVELTVSCMSIFKHYLVAGTTFSQHYLDIHTSTAFVSEPYKLIRN